MICPECGGDTTVIDSREMNRGAHIRRRRACKSCQCRFTTREIVDPVDERGTIPVELDRPQTIRAIRTLFIDGKTSAVVRGKPTHRKV